MNDIIAFKSLYKTLLPVICWLVFSVAVYEAARRIQHKALRVAVAILTAAALTALTLAVLFDRPLLSILKAQGSAMLPLGNALTLEFLILYLGLGALFTAVQSKENSLVQRIAAGFIGAFFAAHFTLSAFVFFY